MQINRPSEKRLRKQLDKWKQSSNTESESDTTEFNSSIRDKQIEVLDMEVQDLVDELDKRGNALVEHPSLTHVRNYQQALASFLRKSLELSKAIDRKKGRRNIEDIKEGREEKEHVIVKTIDEKMDKLAKDVLESEQESIDLAKRVGELQGLVIDLVSTISDEEETT